MKLTAENLLRMAAIVYLLDKHNYDFSGLRFSILPYLRKIAAKKLLPDAFVRYSGTPEDLSRVSNLTIVQQRALLEGRAELSQFKKKRKERSITLTKKLDVKLEPIRNPLVAPVVKEEGDLYEPDRVTASYLKSEAAANVVKVAGAADVAELMFDLICKHSERSLVVSHLARKLRNAGFAF